MCVCVEGRGWTGGHGAAAGPKHRQRSLLLRQGQRVSVVICVGGVCVCVCVGEKGGEEGMDRWTRCSSWTKAPSAVTTSTTGTTGQCGNLCWWCVCVCVCWGEGGEEGMDRWTRCSSWTKTPSAVTTSTTGTTGQCGSLCWWCVGGEGMDRWTEVDTVDQLDCNERHSFHARVGRFSPFLYLRSVAIAVILFWLQLVVLVSPCFLGSRISRDYRFPPAPLFLCSERKPSSLTTGSSKLQFGDRQTRVKTVHYSEDRNSRCDAT